MQLRPLDQVYELISRAGEAGIRFGDIQTVEDPSIGKKAWAHRNRAVRLVNFLVDAGVVQVSNRRARLIPGLPKPDLSQAFGSGHESELYQMLFDGDLLTDILAQGRESSRIDNVAPEEVQISPPILSQRGKNIRLGLPDLIGFVNRAIDGIPYVETHSFEVKNSGGAHREAVFQALGQRALGIYSHSWIIAVVNDKTEGENQVVSLERECADSGIGLIVISESVNMSDLRLSECLRHWPTRVAIEPRRQYDHFTQLKVLDLLRTVVNPDTAEDDQAAEHPAAQ